jgi:hypothetical protein
MNTIRKSAQPCDCFTAHFQEDTNTTYLKKITHQNLCAFIPYSMIWQDHPASRFVFESVDAHIDLSFIDIAGRNKENCPPQKKDNDGIGVGRERIMAGTLWRFANYGDKK